MDAFDREVRRRTRAEDAARAARARDRAQDAARQRRALEEEVRSRIPAALDALKRTAADDAQLLRLKWRRTQAAWVVARVARPESSTWDGSKMHLWLTSGGQVCITRSARPSRDVVEPYAPTRLGDADLAALREALIRITPSSD